MATAAQVGGVSIVIEAIDHATESIEAVHAKLAGLTAPIREVERAFGRMAEAMGFDRIGESLARVTEGVHAMTEGFAHSAERLGVLLLAEGGLFMALRETARDTTKNLHLAQEIGISVEDFTRIAGAASMAGIDVEVLSKSLLYMNRNAVAAGEGNKHLAAAFHRLHVPLKDAHGTMRTSSELMIDLADRFSRMRSPTDRSALAMEIFGRNGAAMLPMLIKGRDNITDLMRVMDRLGITTSLQTALRLEKLTERFDLLGKTLGGIKEEIAGAVAPAITKAFEKILHWFDDNRELIAKTIEKWGEDLDKFVEELSDPASEIRHELAGIGASFSWLGGIFDGFAGIVGGRLKAAMILIGTWIVAPAIGGLVALGEAILGLGAAMFSVAGGIIAGVGLAVWGAWELYENWIAVCDWVAHAWHAFLAHMKGIFLQLGATFAAIAAEIGHAILRVYRQFDRWYHHLTPFLQGLLFLIAVPLAIIDNWSSIEEFFRGMWDRIAGFFEAALKRITAALKSIREALTNIRIPSIFGPDVSPRRDLPSNRAPESDEPTEPTGPMPGGHRPEDPDPEHHSAAWRLYRYLFHHQDVLGPAFPGLPEVAAPPGASPPRAPAADPSLRQLHDRLGALMPPLPQVGPLPQLAALPEPRHVSFHTQHFPGGAPEVTRVADITVEQRPTGGGVDAPSLLGGSGPYSRTSQDQAGGRLQPLMGGSQSNQTVNNNTSTNLGSLSINIRAEDDPAKILAVVEQALREQTARLDRQARADLHDGPLHV